MTRVQRLLRLDPEQRSLLLSAALLDAAIGAALLLLPFRAVRRLVARLAGACSRERQPDPRSVERIAWAVATVSRALPFGTSCLTQALVSQVLLERRGQAACLRLGVARNEEGEFHAHAWIESEGKIVVGGKGATAYTPLPAFDLEDS